MRLWGRKRHYQATYLPKHDAEGHADGFYAIGLGGDEFTVILHALGSQKEAAGVARKIIDAIAEPFNIEGRVQAVSTNIGIVFTASGSIGMQALLRKADEALYEVKRAGRGDYHLLVAE